MPRQTDFVHQRCAVSFWLRRSLWPVDTHLGEMLSLHQVLKQGVEGLEG